MIVQSWGIDDWSMHAGLLERKAAQEEPANQMGEERVDRDRAKATLGASVPLDAPLEVRPQPEIMETGQRHLVSLAAALMGNAAGLSTSELSTSERKMVCVCPRAKGATCRVHRAR